MGEEAEVLGSLAWIVGVAALAPLLVGLLPRVRFPEVVLLLGLGMVIGPDALGLASEGEAISLLAELGLAMLFLFAGLEIEPRLLVSRDGRRAWVAWGVSLVTAMLVLLLALATDIEWISYAALAIALTSTALGALLPILRDSGLKDSPLGSLVMINGAVGEFGPIVAMSLLLSTRGALASLVAILVFGLVAAVLGLLLVRHVPRAERLVAVVRQGQETSAQLPVRLVVLLLVLMLLLASEFGLDVVLGAFVAGGIVRMLLPEEHGPFLARLDGLGFGLLVPVFFVTSGMGVDLRVVVEYWYLVLAGFVLIVLVRGLPVRLLFGHLGRRQAIQLAAFSATGLPIIVAVTTIATEAGAMRPEVQSVAVAAGMVTVLLLPVLAGALSREHGHVGTGGSGGSLSTGGTGR